MYSELYMVDLQSYAVPSEIWQSLESNHRINLDFPFHEIRSNVKNYHQAYNMMVHFEEAAQTKFVQSFDIDDVDIFGTQDENIFYILNDVVFCQFYVLKGR